MKLCYICGKKHNSSTELEDTTFCLFPMPYSVCSECFNEWVSQEFNKLKDKRVKAIQSGVLWRKE